MYKGMVKSRQRSRRKDPDQEAILQVKDQINERMSKLIELLKDVKSGMNGGPAPEVGVPEKVSLTQPLPDSVPSAGNAAVQELSAISQGISQVKQMQDSYAEKREQRLAERSKQMKDLQQQVVEAAVEEELKKTASNTLTRAWAHIVAPFGSEQGRWERLSLLRSLARIDNNLTDIENEVLSSDPSILNALHLAKQLYIDEKSSFFDMFRKQLNTMIESTANELSKVKDEAVSDFFGKSPLKNGPVQMRDETAGATGTTRAKGTNESTHGATGATGPDTAGATGATGDTGAGSGVIDTDLQGTTGTIEPPIPKNILNKLDKAINTAEIAAKNSQIVAETVQNQERELSDKPVQMPISSKTKSKEEPLISSEVEIDKPEVSKPEDEKIESLIEQPESSEPMQVTDEELFEDVLDPPPESPAFDPAEIRKVVRSFMWKNSHDMYSEAYSELSKFQIIPEPWKSRLNNIWQNITISLQAIRTKPNIDKMMTAYMHLIKGIGDLNANIYVLGNELKAAELKPDFTFGSTINDQQLNSQALQFVQSNWNELQSIIPQQGLISEGSDKFTRWLKRIKTHLSWGSDKNLRLLTAKNIRESRDKLQVMLNTLEERNINFRLLIAQSNDFYESFIGVYDMLADLAESYNSRMMIEKSKQKYEKGRMKYDVIRGIDIRGIRNIANTLRNDKESIKSLENLELSYSEIGQEIEKLKAQLTN